MYRIQVKYSVPVCTLYLTIKIGFILSFLIDGSSFPKEWDLILYPLWEMMSKVYKLERAQSLGFPKLRCSAHIQCDLHNASHSELGMMEH